MGNFSIKLSLKKYFVLQDLSPSKDIVSLSLPFLSGVILSSLLPLKLIYSDAAVCGLCSVLCAFLYARKGEKRVYSILMFVFAGMMTSLLGKLGIKEASENRFSYALEALIKSIDNLSFSNSEIHALAKALLTGRREDLSPESIAAFRNAGAAHILSLSGLHMGIIYGILQKSLFWMGNKPFAKILRSGIIIIGALIFTIMTGAPPSVVRAFLFICINELSRLLPGRKHRPLSVLCSALMIQLCVNPSVVSSLGFQLSYMSMLGIFTIYPHLRSWFVEKESSVFHRSLHRIWNAAALSISCQLTTAPLVYFYFKTFPQYFLLSNLVAVPLTEIFVISLIVSLILNIILPYPIIIQSLTQKTGEALIGFLTIVSQM